MVDSNVLKLESYYTYGFAKRNMIAVRAPFATTGEAPDLIGRVAEVGGDLYEIVAVSRQISGPIANGEPIGIEVRRLGSELSR